MLIQELTTPECQDVLRRATIVRLATARDNQPYVVPIHTYFDDDCLYSFGTLGRKIDSMRVNPQVCVEAEEIVDRYHWRTVLVFGRYEELVHTPHYEEFRQRAQQLFTSTRNGGNPRPLRPLARTSVCLSSTGSGSTPCPGDWPLATRRVRTRGGLSGRGG